MFTLLSPSCLFRVSLTSWLVIFDHSRVDVVVAGDDAGRNDGPHDEVEHPLRDHVDLARREEPLVAQSALAQLKEWTLVSREFGSRWTYLAIILSLLLDQDSTHRLA